MPLTFALPWKVTPLASAKVALICETVPVSVIDPVPLFAISVEPRPPDTLSFSVKVPFEAVSVTVISLLPASTSLTERPVTTIGVSSSTVTPEAEAPRLTTGASLTAVAVIGTVPTFTAPEPSSTVMLNVATLPLAFNAPWY